MHVLPDSCFNALIRQGILRYSFTLVYPILFI
jgi:hypothetical protein